MAIQSVCSLHTEDNCRYYPRVSGLSLMFRPYGSRVALQNFSNDRIFFRTRRLLAGSGNSPRLGLPTRASAPPAPRSSARISVKLFNSLVRWSSVSVSPGSGSSPFVPLVFCVRHCLAEISPILLTLLATSRVPRIGVCGTRRQFLVHGVAYGSVLTDRLCRHQLVETCSKSLRDDHKVIHRLMRR